jgi:hypothetical protein
VRRPTLYLGTVLALIMLGAGGVQLTGHAVAQTAPTIQITGPANGTSVTNPVQMHVTSTGATIKPATAGDATAAHYHYFIDRNPSTVLQPGQPIPAGQPDIIHTDDANLTLPTLPAGQHTVWVVLAHTDHTPFSPNVQAQTSFTVGAAAATPAAVGAAPAAAGAASAVAGASALPVTGTGTPPGSGNMLAMLLAAAAVAGVLGLAAHQVGRRR